MTAKATGESIETAARRIRYDYFDRLMSEHRIPILATAHNANDNLETMLFHLARGSGLSGKIIGFAADFAKEKGRVSLRIDTHRGNAVMRRMLEKNGFKYCGIIHLEDGDERLAFQKII